MPWRPLPDPDGDPPAPLSESLDRVLGALGSAPVATVSAVLERWGRIVGPAIASASEPVAIEHGRLVVVVRDGGWASQLRWMETDLVAKITAEVGEGVVERLEVRIRPS